MSMRFGSIPDVGIRAVNLGRVTSPVYALGLEHISSAGAMTACGLMARSPAPARPVPPCGWCRLVQRSRNRCGGFVADQTKSGTKVARKRYKSGGDY